jgi:hypothetical protein
MSESDFAAVSNLITACAWVIGLSLIGLGFSRLLAHGNGDRQNLGSMLAPPVAGLAMLGLQPFFISVATTIGINRSLRLNGGSAAEAVVTAALLNIDRLCTVIGLLFVVRGLVFLAHCADAKGNRNSGLIMISAGVLVANPGWIQFFIGGL